MIFLPCDVQFRCQVVHVPADSLKVYGGHDGRGRHGNIWNLYVVFVDVTAEWCVTCKANKALVIDRGEVARRLKAGESGAPGGVVAMRADWTRPNPVITAYLRRFGRFGIPFNVVYGPGAPAGLPLPELLTEPAVLAGFEAARGTPKGK